MGNVTRPTDDWDTVWRDYDARRAVAAPAVATPMAAAPVAPAGVARPRPAGQRRAPRARLSALAAAVPLAALAYGLAQPPLRLAQEVAEAVRVGDPARIAPHVDWQGLRTDVGLGPAGAGADPFLGQLAGVVAAGQATPAGLLALLGARSRGQQPALRPEGLTGLRLAFPGVLLRLAARSPFSWRIVGVQITG